MRDEKKFKEILSQVIDLSITDTRIIEKIIRNYRYFPFFNYPQFLREIDLSHEEAIAFITSNGYQTFSEMQTNIARVMLDYFPNLTLEEQMNKESLLFEEEISNIVKEIAELEINNIQHMLRSFNVQNINKLIRELATSPEVIIIANRISIPLANYASSIWNRIGINVKTITSADTCIFDTVHNYDRSSLVIVFGFWRYPKDTLKLMNYFKRKNFEIVAITDNEKSPLVYLSKYSIFVRGDSLIYTDSYVNAIILLNSIAIALCRLNQDKVVKRLYEFEETAKNLDYYF